MANHGPVYGLSREIQIKNQARFNLLEAQEVLDWIQECTRIPFDLDPFAMNNENEVAEALKDGVQLCILAERIVGPGKVRYIKNPKQPFHMATKRNNRLPKARFIVKVNDENPRYFPQHVLNQSNAVISLQYGSNKGASQKGMAPYGLPRQILPDGK